ncbi:TPA: cytochrome C biogenesis protein CcdA, partial [Raoultella planticola]
TIGVVVAYTALYVLAFFLCAYIRVEQPGLTRSSVAVALKTSVS